MGKNSLRLFLSFKPNLGGLVLIFSLFLPIILFVRGFAPSCICSAGSRLLRGGKAIKAVEGGLEGKKGKKKGANNPFLSGGLC